MEDMKTAEELLAETVEESLRLENRLMAFQLRLPLTEAETESPEPETFKGVPMLRA